MKMAYYLFNYQLSPEIPPGSTKFDIVEVANEDKLVMSFLEADFSINQFMHALPNIPAAAGALNAIQNAQVIWVGVEPEPHPLMAVNSAAVVYISCDNETPYAATDGRIYTVWWGPNFEASDTRFWDRNIDATQLVDIPPQIFAPTPPQLITRFYRPDDIRNLDPSRMGIIVDDDIKLVFTANNTSEEKQAFNASHLDDAILDRLTTSLALGTIFPTYALMLSGTGMYSNLERSSIFTVADASGDPEIDSGMGVYFYDHPKSLATGESVVTRIHDDVQLDVQLILPSILGGPMIDGAPITSEEFDAVGSTGHSHPFDVYDTAGNITANGTSGNLIYNNVELQEGLPLDGNGTDTW